MHEVGTRLVSLSGLPQNRRPAVKSEAGPNECFIPGEASPGLMQRPHFDSPAEQPLKSGKKGLGVGHKVALITAGLAAGAGAIGLATAHPGATNPQVQLSQRDANRALDNFAFLEQVVTPQGGSLKSDPQSLTARVFHHQQEVDAPGALQALSQGYTVYVYPTAESEEGIPIRSSQQLRQITNQAREEVAKNNLRQGLENLREGLKDLGDNLREGLEDIFR